MKLLNFLLVSIFLINSTLSASIDMRSHSFKEVLRLTGINPELSDNEIVTTIDKEWRLKTKERSQATDTEEWSNLRELLMPHFELLGLVNTIEPMQQFYASALIVGAKMVRVEKRIESFLERISNESLTVGTLYLLAGERRLEEDEKEMLRKMDLFAEDERDMVELVAARMIPSNVNYVVIKACKADGAIRATSVETLTEWLTNDPDSPTLLISSQPYGLYLLSFAKGVVPERYKLDLLAVETVENRVSIYLDTLARSAKFFLDCVN